jgi:hypothetical protein
MHNNLDSLTSMESIAPKRQARRSRQIWLRRVLVSAAAEFVIGVLLYR